MPRLRVFARSCASYATFARVVGLSVGTAALVLAASCSKSSSPDAPGDTPDADTRPPTPPEWDRAVTRPDDATASASRAACKFARGALPAETLGPATPLDQNIPIETVVVVMQENRSFDSYLGHLNKYAGRTDIESAPDSATNPDQTGAAPGATHPWVHQDHLCVLDPNHEWAGAHQEFDLGKMDGFVQASQGWAATSIQNPTPALEAGARAMGWYDEHDIPFYYDLAKTFAIADHYHAALLGPTWPNRMFFYSATSFGRTDSSFPDLTAYPFPANDATVFDELEKRHVDWGVYYTDSPGLAIVYASTLVNRWGRDPLYSIDQFFTDAAAGKLPQVVLLDAVGLSDEKADTQDEHPPGDIQAGQKWVSDIVHAMMASPQWKTSALFLTYDEHGGFYDHVAPPKACAPDTTAPVLTGANVGVPGGFDQLGVRVPLVVVSPFAKRGYVSKVTYDHSSITRFIETKFKIPALTGRDANADPMMDLFDFQNPPFVDPPTIAAPDIDATELSYCKATFVTAP